MRHLRHHSHTLETIVCDLPTEWFPVYLLILLSFIPALVALLSHPHIRRITAR